jgi:hypothetical protein
VLRTHIGEKTVLSINVAGEIRYPHATKMSVCHCLSQFKKKSTNMD